MVVDNDSDDKGPKVGILIADGDKATRAFFNTALTKAGRFTIWTAATSKEALECLNGIDPEELSVIVFDLTQEGLEGHVLLQKVRANPALLGKGILVCSDKLTQDDRFLLKEMDVKHFLGKSVGTGEFIDMIVKIDKEVREKKPLIIKMKELELALQSRDTEKCNSLIGSQELMATDDADLVPLKAEVMLANNEIEKAIDTLKQFLQHQAKAGKPETFRALSAFGKALCMANRYDEALGIFQRLSEKSPSNLNHKVNLGEALLGKGDIEGAEKKFSEVLEKDPENSKAMVGMGGARIAAGDTEAGISLLSKITGPIESYSLASYFNNAAVALTRKGQAGDAVKLYGNAIQFFDKYKPLIYFNMGMAQLRAGKVNVACECFDYVLKLEKGPFIEKKAILREYRDMGLDHMIKKYGGDKKADGE